MPTYIVEAVVQVTLSAPDPTVAAERVIEELENHCSQVDVTAVM